MQALQSTDAIIVLILLGLIVAQTAYLLLTRNKINQERQILRKTLDADQSLKQELERYKAKFSEEILRDLITGLPSFAVFKEKAWVIFNQSKANGAIFGIVCVNIRNFKMVNNTLGAAAGDEVLRQVGERLQAALRQIDILCRYSGDTFIILLSQLSNRETAALVVQRLFKKLASPYHLQQHELTLPANMGIAIYPGDGASLDAVIRNATHALSQSKAAGIQHYQYYENAMHTQGQRELELNSALSRDLIFSEIKIEYQPILNTQTQKIYGWEVQVHWQHPEFGTISAQEFMHMAINSGRIEAIGEWVIQHICHQQRLWQEEGATPLLALSVSLQQLESLHFISMIFRVFQETKADPRAFIFQIAEGEMLHHNEAVAKGFSVLNQLGVRIAIDHFGGGDILLRHLKCYHVDYLKIDESFVQGLTQSKECEVIIGAMAVMAKNLEKQLIAVGVTTAAQRELLQSLGCNLMQGEVFSAPVIEDQMSKKLADSKSVQQPNLPVF